MRYLYNTGFFIEHGFAICCYASLRLDIVEGNFSQRSNNTKPSLKIPYRVTINTNSLSLCRIEFTRWVEKPSHIHLAIYHNNDRHAIIMPTFYVTFFVEIRVSQNTRMHHTSWTA